MGENIIMESNDRSPQQEAFQALRDACTDAKVPVDVPGLIQEVLGSAALWRQFQRILANTTMSNTWLVGEIVFKPAGGEIRIPIKYIKGDADDVDTSHNETVATGKMDDLLKRGTTVGDPDYVPSEGELAWTGGAIEGPWYVTLSGLTGEEDLNQSRFVARVLNAYWQAQIELAQIIAVKKPDNTSGRGVITFLP